MRTTVWEVLGRLDARTERIPKIEEKLDQLHELKASVIWLTWGVRGIYGSIVGLLIWAISR